MPRSRLTSMLVVTSSLALALAACGSGGTQEPVDTGTGGEATGGSGGDGSRGSLILAEQAEPQSFDPTNVPGATSYPYYQAVYDTLLRAAPDGTIEPMLATDWSYDESLTELTLTLRDDVTFEDGTSFTAEVAQQNLERYRDSSASDAGTLAILEDVEVVSDTELVLHLSTQDPAFLVYMTTAATFMLNPASFDDPDLATSPDGTGPYRLDEGRTVVGSQFVYTANEDYWNPELQHYDEITIKVMVDATARVNALLSGEVDVAPAPSADRTALEGAGLTTNRNAVNWFGLNIFDRDGSIKPELADVRVRQAINHAVDTEGILNSLGVGDGTLTSQIFPETSAAYLPELEGTYAFDPDRSRELLAEAGLEDGFDLQLASTTGLIDAAFFATLAQQLSDVGINTTLTEYPLSDYTATILGGTYPMALFLFGQASDWEIVTQYVTPESRWNVFENEDPVVAELVETIRTTSEDEQVAALQELNRHLVDEAWFGPWYRPDIMYFTNDSVNIEVQAGRAVPYIYNYSPANS